MAKIAEFLKNYFHDIPYFLTLQNYTNTNKQTQVDKTQKLTIKLQNFISQEKSLR